MRPVSVDDAPASAFGLADRLTPGEGPWHQHRRHQLLYAASGRLTLELDDAAWTLPPQRAAWIRSNTLHRVCLTRPVELRAVYLSPEFCPALNTDARVFAIDELTRQLLLASVRFGPARDPDDPLANDLLRTLAGLASTDLASPRHPDPLRGTPTAPPLPPAADALARFLAAHAVDARSRAAFVLSEFAGLGSAELATLMSCELGPLHAALRRLRQALASDPEVGALGGPRSLLAASLAPFLADAAWTRRHAALLAAHARAPRPVPGDILRRPAGIIGLGLAAIALLLLLRPAPPIAPRPRPAPLVVAVPRPPPAPAPAPAILLPPPPVPETMSPEPSTKRLARVRTPRKRPASSSAPDALARREQQARSRDPGAIIIELEMIGAGRKALAASPAQALAYAEQHARDYPESQLVTQRAELRVRALCALGRRDEARAEADRRGPGKVRDALTQACGL